MLFPMCYPDQIESVEIQEETVAALEIEHHLQVTCQTLAEASAGGVWIELVIIPLACWELLFPHDLRMV